MKNKTLFWLLCVIAVYLFFIPKTQSTQAAEGNTGRRVLPEDWADVPFRGGYTI